MYTYISENYLYIEEKYTRNKGTCFNNLIKI